MDTSIAAVVAATKAEILADIANGTVPETVSSFSELHDYTDANMYADELICNRLMEGDEYLTFINAITDEVDVWLRTGRPVTWLPLANEDVAVFVKGRAYVEDNENGYTWEIYGPDVNDCTGDETPVLDGTADTLAEAFAVADAALDRAIGLSGK